MAVVEHALDVHEVHARLCTGRKRKEDDVSSFAGNVLVRLGLVEDNGGGKLHHKQNTFPAPSYLAKLNGFLDKLGLE